jgi:hypothetical protein
MNNAFSKEQLAQLKGLFYEHELAMRREFAEVHQRLDQLFETENDDILALHKTIQSHDRRLARLEKTGKR